MFSDGVTEACNQQEEEFGENRLISCVIADHARPSPNIVKTILNAVQEFSGKAPQTDDITVAVIRFQLQG